MKPGFVPGVTGEISRSVTPDVTITLGDPPYAPEGGTSRPASGATVFATPYMIELMEHAARKAVEPFIEPDEETVGAEVRIQHIAATKPGDTVRAVARLVSIEGRKLHFEVEAFDSEQKIGEGTHTRVAITTSRFRDKLGQTPDRDAQSATGTGDTQAPAKEGPSGPARTLHWRTENGIGYLTLNRPRVRNAVNIRMVEELEELQQRLMSDEQTRVVIVTGAEEAFCAGDDVKEVGGLTPEQAEALSLRQARMFHRFHDLPQPFIAAVNGPAMGAGCVFAAFCDLRVASHAATFGMPEIHLGWAPGYGNAQIMDLVGPGRAREMILTGDPIAAQEAYRIGLVERLAAQNSLMRTAEDLAKRLLDMPPIALRETKRLLHRDAAANPRESYADDTATYIRCFRTDDAKEGIAAFLGKRKPNWSKS